MLFITALSLPCRNGDTNFPQDFTNYIRVFGQFESCLHLQKEGNVIAFNLVSLVEYLGRFHACLDTFRHLFVQ